MKNEILNDSWKIVQHSWNETGIYSKESNYRIFKMNTEDWDVNEDNQYEMEEVQLSVAKVIAASPDMFKILQKLQEGIMNGSVTLGSQLQEEIAQTLNKATTAPIE